MRVLAHIHTLNDDDVIDRAIEAILRQTRPVDGIVIVDNASTDGTLERQSVKCATVLRHPENRGTSGAVHSGFRFALEQDYEWIWVFDADSAPEPDALERLLDLYAEFPPNLRDEAAFLACLHQNVQDGIPRHGRIFSRRRFRHARPIPKERYYPCHVNIWSGCLYRLAAVRRIGLPNPNYVLDWGEGEYGYRVMKAGYKGFIHREAVLMHNIRGYAGCYPVEIKHGNTVRVIQELPPIRCYYSCRNRIYFAIYEFGEGNFWQVLDAIASTANLMLGFLVRPRSRRSQLIASFRGLWHGFTGNIAARY
jgi:GT2 family glycosyltransferase